METPLLLFIVIGSLLILLSIGVPIAFSLGSLATLFILFSWGSTGLYTLFQTAYDKSGDFILLAIPMFILMANVLGTSGMGDDLYELIYRWMGNVRGGLAIGTVFIGAIFAAMAGISAVALVTMGIIALPSMLNRGYNQTLALGSILAGGSLGILIPPSIIMVVYGAMTGVSIGKLFIGGVIPGLILVAIFSVYIYVRVLINPQMASPVEKKYTFAEKLAVLKGTILPILLILAVLGTIYSGVCTPTEASAIGASGAILCALIYRKLTWTSFKNSLFSTIRLNAMVFWLLIGAMAFNHLLAYLQVQGLIAEAVFGLDLSRWTILIGIQLMLLVLGMFIDPIGILMLTLPIIDPLVSSLNFDPVWFGVLFTINMEMGFMTPPFGFNLFTLKGVIPPSISMADLYRAVYPFVALVALGLAFMIIFPDLVLWLPDKMMSK